MKTAKIIEAALDLGWKKAAEKYSVDFESIKTLIEFLLQNEMKNEAFTVAKKYLSPVLLKEINKEKEFKNCKLMEEEDTLKKYGLFSENVKNSKNSKNRNQQRRHSLTSEESSRTQKKSRYEESNKKNNRGRHNQKSKKKNNNNHQSHQNKKPAESEIQSLIESLGIRYSKDIFLIQNSEKNFEYMIDHFQGAKVISFSIKTHNDKISLILLASFDTVAVFDCQSLQNNPDFQDFMLFLFCEKDITKITLNFIIVAQKLADMLRMSPREFLGIVEISRFQIKGKPMHIANYGASLPEEKLRLILSEFMNLDPKLVSDFPKEVNLSSSDFIDLDMVTLEVYLFLRIFIHFDNNSQFLYKNIIFTEDIVNFNKTTNTRNYQQIDEKKRNNDYRNDDKNSKYSGKSNRNNNRGKKNYRGGRNKNRGNDRKGDQRKNEESFRDNNEGRGGRRNGRKEEKIKNNDDKQGDNHKQAKNSKGVKTEYYVKVDRNTNDNESEGNKNWEYDRKDPKYEDQYSHDGNIFVKFRLSK